MNLFNSIRIGMLLAFFLSVGAASAQSAARVDVFKSPSCGCCEKWVEHLRSNGFDVVATNVNDVAARRKSLGMADRFASCHTATVGGYVIEGHVPAEDIAKLLKEKPHALGLAAPGMPQGSPGMETLFSQPYNTLLVHSDGSATVFAQH
jgi:hypothetical protein